MQFSLLATALLFLAAIARCAVVSKTNPTDNNGCITVDQIEGVHAGLMHLSNHYRFPFPADFPDLTHIRTMKLNDCVEKSIAEAAASSMSNVGKKYDFESKYAEFMGRQAKGTVHAPALLFKRIRDCPAIGTDTKAAANHTWSCTSAPHFNSCKTCVGFATLGFMASIGVCTAKKLEETVPCCIVSAMAFLSTYSNTCLRL